MARKSDPAQAVAWRERFSRFESSPLTTAQFCVAEGVSTASFYAWRRKLRPGSRRRQEQPAPSGPFQQVLVSPAPTLAAHLPGGVRLEVCGACQQTVRTVVRELVRRARASEVPSC